MHSCMQGRAFIESRTEFTLLTSSDSGKCRILFLERGGSDLVASKSLLFGPMEVGRVGLKQIGWGCLEDHKADASLRCAGVCHHVLERHAEDWLLRVDWA